MRTFLALRLTFADMLVFIGNGARDTLTDLYDGLASGWCTLRGAAYRVIRDIDRDTKRNPGLICALAGIAIVIVWLATS